jgi:hypothetical protein
MIAQAPVRTGPRPTQAQVAERQARSARGVAVLVAGVVAVLAGVAVLWSSGKQTGEARTALVWTGIVVLLIAVLGLAGLTPVVPGQARVIQLFGKYRGTIRDPGLQWVNPFTRRIRVSTRIRNHETAQAKVNDADGNPIEIAAVVVWQVQDTAKAIYSVDEYTKYEAIQTETRSGTSPPATPTPATARASCRCATTPKRSPSGCQPRSLTGSPRPGCRSSSHA